jgi:hypothetical protein
MNTLDLGGQSMDGHLLRTVAWRSDSRKRQTIMMGLGLSCVINGGSLTDVLDQATRLTVAITVLIIVWAVLPKWGRWVGSHR